jgi:hypothetical protein
MSQKLTDRPYWPDLLALVEEMVAEGYTDTEIGFKVEAEFGLRRQSFRTAVRRGDVPAMPSPDRARSDARARGDRTFDGKPCVRCGSKTRYVADQRCLACERTYYRDVEAN